MLQALFNYTLSAKRLLMSEVLVTALHSSLRWEQPPCKPGMRGHCPTTASCTRPSCTQGKATVISSHKQTKERPNPASGSADPQSELLQVF